MASGGGGGGGAAGGGGGSGGGAAGGGGGSAAVQTELQLRLTDQRLHLEQSRIDHSTLQSRYQRLEDELAAVKDALESVVEERDRTVSRHKCLLEQCRRDISAKHVECEEYKLLNPQRVEQMRNEIYRKVEKLFHFKLEQVSGDLQNVRHDFNRVSHELSLCEAELDEEKKECVTAIEDLKRRHDSELSSWKSENERLRQKVQSLQSSDVTQQLNQLQMENDQLHRKINDLTLQKSDESGMGPDAITRQQTKNQTTEQDIQIKQLKLRLDEKELAGVDREQQLNRLLDEIHELEKDRNVLKRQTEELKTQFQRNINSLRLEKMTECRELEKRVEELQQSLNDGNDELKALKADMTAKQDKARTHSQDLQTTLESEWKNLNRLQNEKMELETKLETIERKRLDEEEEQERMIETIQDRLKNAEQKKEEAEHQAETYRVQLESQQWLLNRSTQTDFYSSTLDLKLQLSCLDDDYQSCLRQQLEKVDRLSVDLHNAKTELIQSQTALTTDRQQMQNEIQDLREELTKFRRQSINNLRFYKGRLKVWRILEKKLKQNLEVLRSDLSKLKIEKESAAYGSRRPAHASESTTETRRQQLCELMEKHRQFSAILLPTATNLSLPEAVAHDQPQGSPDLSVRIQQD